MDKTTDTPITSGEVLEKGRGVWEKLIQDESDDAQSMFYYHSVETALCHAYGAAMMLNSLLSDKNEPVQKIKVDVLTNELKEGGEALPLFRDMLTLVSTDIESLRTLRQYDTEIDETQLKAYEVTQLALENIIAQTPKEA